MDEDIKKIASAFGRMGGYALRDKYGSDHFKEMQKKGVESRRRNKARLLVDKDNKPL
jgi:hypothetical protein